MLNGFFIREDMSIQIEGLPKPLVFRTYYGYDPRLKQHFGYSVDNMGSFSKIRITFPGKKMVSSSDSMQGPKRVIAQWTTEFTDTGMNVLSLQAIDGGKFFQHVKGSYTRVPIEQKPKLSAFINASHSFEFPGIPVSPDKMGRFKGMLGDFEFTGGMVVATGAPLMEIGGRSHIQTIFGGKILEHTIKGSPSPMGSYEGWGVMAWNEAEKCYDSVWCSNMGAAEYEQCSWVGKHLVTTSKIPNYDGKLAVHRTVASFDANGILKRNERHSIIGAEAPAKTFYLDYKLVK